MNVCLIGHGIPCLILANVLINRNIKVSIFDDIKSKKKFRTRTLGISKKNINFLKKEKINIARNAWIINNIKIFKDVKKDKEILNFGTANDKLFSIIKYDKLDNLLKKNIKKKNLFKYIKQSRSNFYNSIIHNKNKFDLIINFDEKNKITRELFFRKQYKNYNSIAFTSLINHKKCENRTAYQIFTKFGPIAFLPCSKTETSIVFSVLKQSKNLKEEEILKLINKYNKKYLIKSFSKLEKFNLKGFLLKNYYTNNILCFGDNIHKIHPLAGQGLNMTIRDINVLLDLIDKKKELGLNLDRSILKDFENKTKHYNYLFASGIDLIFEFFKIDNKLESKYSDKLFNFLENNSIFKKYSVNFADKGLS